MLMVHFEPSNFMLCMPNGVRFLRVKIPNTLSSGKDIAGMNDVHREVEYKGIWM